MAKELMNQIGACAQDNLIAAIYPRAEVTGAIIRKVDAETVLPRGTVMAISSKDNKLVVLGASAAEGETLTAGYILADETTAQTEDTACVVYRAGCFNADALTVADGYSMTVGDKDNLRKYGIVMMDNMQ